MAKIKGIYKGFKFMAKMFVVKEREMEIGYPTDVKHVAHVGWEGSSGSAPSWMNEFKPAPDFSNSVIVNPIDSNSLNFSPWSSQDFDHSTQRQSVSAAFNDVPPSDLPNIPKKQKTKKKASSTSSESLLTSKPSRQAKSKATTFNKTNWTMDNQRASLKYGPTL